MNSPTNSKKQDLRELKEFVSSKMSMTANYQPVIIRELLDRGGHATKSEIALAIILEQSDVVKYWQKILMTWPDKILRKKHGIVAYDPRTKTFELVFDLSKAHEVNEIRRMCDVKIADFKKLTIKKASGIRYKLIEAAKGCCQACGALASEENPLDIDHIVPQVKAKDGKIRTAEGKLIGVNDEENLQVLCQTCNSGKRDQGHFNFKPSQDRLAQVVREILEKAKALDIDVADLMLEAQKPPLQ